ncbi:MAG: NFACT RNA binding domain-containing protein [Candidatus Micrarchaeaceae archaeon]
MELELDYNMSAQDNANAYYTKAKRLMQKKDGAQKAVEELKRRLAQESEGAAPKKNIVIKRRLEWYEKFNWFFTSGGKLVIGGRDAQQNEIINSRHFGNEDLFFHADIHGASVTVMKEGVSSEARDREEAAQFAASFSRGWQEGLNSVDVYCMRREQVSKSTGKGSLGTGSFLLSGEREWYRNVPLLLACGVKGSVFHVVPEIASATLAPGKILHISQGRKKKSDAAKLIATLLNYDDVDYIMQHMPNGNFNITE